MGIGASSESSPGLGKDKIVETDIIQTSEEMWAIVELMGHG